MWHKFISQNQVCFERILNFGRTLYILVEISTPPNLHSTQFLPCFMVIEPVVTKQWPMNFDRLLRLTGSILLTAMIRTTEAQRWRVVGSSLAGVEVVAIDRIFDILARTVRGILARHRANTEQSGRSAKVVALFLLQTLVAIWYNFFNCMIQSKWNQIIQE